MSGQQKNNSLKIAIAGLGTVGSGVLKILHDNKEILHNRTDREIEIVAVSARDKSKDRGVDLSKVKFVDDARELAKLDGVDTVIELIGGADGVAYELVKSALENGKNVITANKALIAKHGANLAKIAEEKGVALQFEASVAGGIPIIKTLKEGLVSNKILKIEAILNGTCNFILTKMAETGKPFEEILKEAQELGYAEADPSFDIDGVDAAHKLVILSAIAFGIKPNIEATYIEGIRNIDIRDIRYASKLGYNIRLLAVCQQFDDAVEQRVHPVLVSNDEDIGIVEGVLGAVKVETDNLGKYFCSGAGAGMMQTASSVVSDIADIATGRSGWGRKTFAFNVKAEKLRDTAFKEIDKHYGEFYIRLTVKDQDGVLSSVTAILSKHGIGLERIAQEIPVKGTADIVILTHEEVEEDIDAAVDEIAKNDYMAEAPVMIRMED